MSKFFKRQLNDLSFWYPILKDLWIPTPETYIIRHNVKLLEVLDGTKPKLFDKLISDIEFYANIVWYPCFIKTWCTSNKHSWKNTCYLEKKEDISQHIYNLVEFSAIADFELPLWVDTIVIRKLLKTKEFFTWFEWMPITREVRIFVKSWEVYHIQPYWPIEAFDWRKKFKFQKEFKELNKFTEEDLKEFNKMWTFIWKMFQWHWSIDLLQWEDWVWYCIDMALWSDSYMNEKINLLKK